MARLLHFVVDLFPKGPGAYVNIQEFRKGNQSTKYTTYSQGGLYQRRIHVIFNNVKISSFFVSDMH